MDAIDVGPEQQNEKELELTIAVIYDLKLHTRQIQKLKSERKMENAKRYVASWQL